YARFLALTGDVTEAIAAYTRYLQEYPGDLDTMLELGILLSDVGAREAAESALGHIRDTDPNHPAGEKLTQILKQK
ncbi:MAG: tetratricopeptide repeat protein, partial [Pseudomonadota bacterium]|nr:tetratricopeptide repeat protein [Pseudomonadota bacterium]